MPRKAEFQDRTSNFEEDNSKGKHESSDIQQGSLSGKETITRNNIIWAQQTIGNKAVRRLINDQEISDSAIQRQPEEDMSHSLQSEAFPESNSQDRETPLTSIKPRSTDTGEISGAYRLLQIARPIPRSAANINRSVDNTIQRSVTEFIPEAAFVEDERGHLALFTETVPSSSIVRRHDPYKDLIDPFISDLNEWVPTTWRISNSVNRLEAALEHGGAISPDPSRALSEHDREVLANATDSETLDALREIEGDSVADRLGNVESATSALRVARHQLESARERLDARQASIERGEAEGDVAAIEAKKAEIMNAIGIATTVITVLAAGPAATTAAITTAVQARIRSAPTDIIGAVVDMAYDQQLSELERRIERLTAREESAITGEIQASVNAALDQVSVAQADARVASIQAENAMAHRTNQFTSLGSRIDDTVSSDDSMTRYQTIFRISSAVQETAAVVEHSLRMSRELPGIVEFMAETRRGTYLGIPGTGPREWDTGQNITFRHTENLRNYVYWLANMHGDLHVWSDGWRDVTELVGGGGSRQPEY